jgi:hypothetical protein
MMESQRLGVQEDDRSSTNQQSQEPFADAVMSYESFDEFVVTLPESESGKEVKYVFSRRGNGWKLSDILFPML